MRSLLRHVLLLAAPALVLASCSSPTDAPAPAAALANRTATSGGPDLSRLARFDQRPSITIAWAKQWIGPEGGRLEFRGFAVEVPPGAVDRMTQFSIRLPVDPKGSERVVAEFGPHGASFAQPVRIEFPYSGTSIYGDADARVVWWDQSLGAWVDVGGQATSDGMRLQTLTDHFSTYGTTSEQRGGSVLVSGG